MRLIKNAHHSADECQSYVDKVFLWYQILKKTLMHLGRWNNWGSTFLFTGEYRHARRHVSISVKNSQFILRHCQYTLTLNTVRLIKNVRHSADEIFKFMFFYEYFFQFSQKYVHNAPNADKRTRFALSCKPTDQRIIVEKPLIMSARSLIRSVDSIQECCV